MIAAVRVSIRGAVHAACYVGGYVAGHALLAVPGADRAVAAAAVRISALAAAA